MFETLRRTLAAWFASPARPASPARAGTRMYAMGRPGRTTSGWGSQTTSEDTELSTSLRTARNRSRELCRDAAYAKRAKVIIQNNIVGTGIGLQATVETTRGAFNERVNDEIESVWKRWGKPQHCHTGRSLHFSDMQRMLVGEWFEAGEIFIRLHRTAMPGSPVPLALEVIEPERIADQFQPSPVEGQASARLGIEVDRFGAPVAYWIRSLHPGELHLTTAQTDRVERVPADDIIHLRTIDRWPQTRSIPWMHAAGRKLNDMDGLTEAEITAARASACYMGFVEPSPSGDSSFDGPAEEETPPEEELEPAVIRRLNAGEKFTGFSPTRPNTQIDPFMRMMLREVAAGTGPSYESLSRDYSQSNYSSSRLGLLDDRDLWRVLQGIFMRSVMERVYRVWLQQAILARAITSISVESYALHMAVYEEAVRFKPRGWSWVDPTKEVEAYTQAIAQNMTTLTAVIAQTADGRDLEDILKERKRELELMESMGLSVVPRAPSGSGRPKAEGAVGADDETDDPAVQKAEKLLRAEVQRGRTHAGSR